MFLFARACNVFAAQRVFDAVPPVSSLFARRRGQERARPLQAPHSHKPQHKPKHSTHAHTHITSDCHLFAHTHTSFSPRAHQHPLFSRSHSRENAHRRAPGRRVPRPVGRHCQRDDSPLVSSTPGPKTTGADGARPRDGRTGEDEGARQVAARRRAPAAGSSLARPALPTQTHTKNNRLAHRSPHPNTQKTTTTGSSPPTRRRPASTATPRSTPRRPTCRSRRRAAATRPGSSCASRSAALRASQRPTRCRR